MQVNVQILSPVLVQFDVEVGADRVTSEVQKAYSNIAKTARVRGFRPGKAPRGVLTHVYGPRIAADVSQRLVDETFQKAVADRQITPVNSPAFEAQRLVENRPFTYKARFEVIPSIAEVNYEGLVAKRPKVAASEEQIAAELEKVQRRLSTLEAPAVARPAQQGDVLTIDVEVSVDGVVVADAGAKDFDAELGAEALLPAIEQALLGKSVGDVATAEVDMPAQHPAKSLQGKRATFSLSIKELKQRVLPAADDELAKDAGEFDTLDQLKLSLKENIERAQKEQAENSVAEQLVVELVKANSVPVPPSLVERQMQVTEQEILAQARRQGQGGGGLNPELREKVRIDAEVKVRAGLLMAEIAKRQGLRIGNEEIEEGLKELAQQSGKNLARVRAEYSDPKAREMLIGMILENKVLDIIESKAKIEDA